MSYTTELWHLSSSLCFHLYFSIRQFSSVWDYMKTISLSCHNSSWIYLPFFCIFLTLQQFYLSSCESSFLTLFNNNLNMRLNYGCEWRLILLDSLLSVDHNILYFSWGRLAYLFLTYNAYIYCFLSTTPFTFYRHNNTFHGHIYGGVNCLLFIYHMFPV